VIGVGWLCRREQPRTSACKHAASNRCPKATLCGRVLLVLCKLGKIRMQGSIMFGYSGRWSISCAADSGITCLA